MDDPDWTRPALALIEHFPSHYWQRVDDQWAKNETAQEIVNLRKREAHRLAPINWPILRTARTEREGD